MVGAPSNWVHRIGLFGVWRAIMAANTKPAISAMCSRKVFISAKRAGPSRFQNVCARIVTISVNMPRAPAPSHAQRLKITSREPPSCTIKSGMYRGSGWVAPTIPAISASAACGCATLSIPLHQYGSVSATRASHHAMRLSRIAATQAGVPDEVDMVISKCPARTAERAPESVRVGKICLGRKSVPVHAARIYGDAGRHSVYRTFQIATAEIRRGPIRHRRRDLWIKRSEVAIGKYDLAIDNSQHRGDATDVVFGHVEVVIRQHGKVRQLSYLDLSLETFLVREPGIGAGIQIQRFGPIDPVTLRI